MQYAINKQLNEYAESIPREVFENTPKAVWAAIAISLATCGGSNLNDAARAVIREWSILNENKIILQPIPSILQKYNQPDPNDL